MDVNFNEYNLIAKVNSIYHFLGALSFANNLSNTQKVNALILIDKHFLYNNPIREGFYEFDNCNLKMINYSNNLFNMKINLFKFIKSFFMKFQNSSLLYILTVKTPNFKLIYRIISNFNIRISSVVIDEGIGSYYNYSGFLFPFKSKLKKLFFKYFSDFEEFFLLKKENGILVANLDTVSAYRDTIKKYSPSIFFNNNEKRNILKKNKSNHSLILATNTQIELGYCKEDKYYSFFNKIFEILSGYNIDIYIKPHPGEVIGKYDNYEAHILPYDIPLEALYSELCPNLVFGFYYSTSTVNANLLYNISSYDLSALFYKTINSKLPSQLKSISGLFSAYLKDISTFEELKVILDTTLCLRNND
jgi:hypothetical protein